jgi:hypothetical protein
MHEFATAAIKSNEAFRQTAEKGVAQAKDTYEKAKVATEQATDILKDTYATAAKGATEYNLKIIEIARGRCSKARCSTYPSDHLRPSCTIVADGSLSPDSFRARRMLVTEDLRTLDFCFGFHHITAVGQHCGRPAYLRHIAQVLHSARSARRGFFGECPTFPRLSFGQRPWR